MSLIVHVNSGAAASSSATSSANTQPTVVVAASTPEPPVTIQSSLATLVAAAEQQQKQQQQQQQQQKLHQHVQRGEPPSGVPTITRITTNINPHIVQHHPPPLRMVQLSAATSPLANGPTVVTLPQSPAPLPLRHVLPQSPVGRPHPQLPRSPVRQHQLPTTPLQRSVVQQQQQQQQQSRNQPQLRTTAVTVINGGQQCITVNPAGRNSAAHLTMLPQAPTPGLLPSAASLHGLLPQSPATLMPLPAHHRIQPTNLVTANSTAILPPTYLNRQLFSRSGLTPENASLDG